MRDQGRVLQPDRRLLHRRANDRAIGSRSCQERGRTTKPSWHRDPLRPRFSSQFRSRKFVEFLQHAGITGSMGRVGACGDNAAMESFFALLQKNVLEKQRFRTRQELRLEIVTWIERTYHRRRRQRALNKLTPIEYEMITTQTVTLTA